MLFKKDDCLIYSFSKLSCFKNICSCGFKTFLKLQMDVYIIENIL